MKMNHYLWSIYLQAGGQEVVDCFSAFENGNREGFLSFVLPLIGAYCPDAALINDFENDIGNALLTLEEQNQEKFTTNESISATENFAVESRLYMNMAEMEWQLLQKNLSQELSVVIAERDALYTFCHNIVYFSVLAYAEAPSMYIPYFFLCLYNVLTAIADLFEIELPTLPSQRSYKKRFLLYYELCETFARWRDEQGWSSAELCAFLYDFGPKYAGGINWLWKKLPEPHAAFVIGAPPAANNRWQAAGEGAIFAWQGNPDTQPGDIIVMYQWAPTSAVTSIWEAVSPGFVDPFFVHYRCIYIGNQKNVLPLSYQTMKSDAVLGQTALVKTRMLGMDGTELKPSQYNIIWNLLSKSGQANPQLPRLTNHFDGVDSMQEIQTEHDVERLLLEPFLERLGWSRKHYIRQMPLRMGRGSSVYPDYVILPQFTPNCEKGFWVVEAKKSIPSDKQLRVDCRQAASYAYRLDTAGLMLVAQEGIWLAERKDDFAQLQHYTWTQLQDSDIFSLVYAKIGNRKKKR